MPWGASKEKKEEKEPDVTEEEVLAFMINESTNDTLESTRCFILLYLKSVNFCPETCGGCARSRRTWA